MPWSEAVIGVVAGLLLLNLVVALAIFAGRGMAGGWRMGRLSRASAILLSWSRLHVL
jgi:hypothetical protein